ncbi:MAG: hypothetical protein MZV64_31570 [Ignavibacteriales bacterium]|nr:hypothetical protein [Ignavibacteriales bacterium]
MTLDISPSSISGSCSPERASLVPDDHLRPAGVHSVQCRRSRSLSRISAVSVPVSPLSSS